MRDNLLMFASLCARLMTVTPSYPDTSIWRRRLRYLGQHLAWERENGRSCVLIVGKLARRQSRHCSTCIPFLVVRLGMLADCCLYENVAWCFTHLAATPAVEFSLFLNSIDVIGQAMSPVFFFSTHSSTAPHPSSMNIIRPLQRYFSPPQSELS